MPSPRTRSLALLALLPLTACGGEGLGPAALASGATLVVTGKTPLDHAAGLATGQDCSAVRWERHGPWCVRPVPPLPEPVCTRSLGAPDCWAVPPRTGALYAGRRRLCGEAEPADAGAGV